MKIACMIPTFYSGDVIKYCIGSIIDQIDKIIVVDGVFTGKWAIYTGKNEGKIIPSDFSQDDTEKICKSFGDKVVFCRQIGPPGSKLNKYLHLVPADYNWILELDADEVMCDNGINHLRYFLDTALAKKYGNFALRYYHVWKTLDEQIATQKFMKLDNRLKATFCYVTRLHYYEKGFTFDGNSSEIMRNTTNTVYNPAPKEIACYGGSYPVPEDVCKLVHLRFWRKNAFNVKRIIADYYDEDIQKETVTLRYGQYICDFVIKPFDKHAYSVLK